MQSAKIRLPKITTKKVWLGMYYNHYNAVIIFNKKPMPSKEESRYMKGQWFDISDNLKIVAGCMGKEEFSELFQTIDISTLLNEHGNSKTLEPQELIECKLSAFWDTENKLETIEFHMDGY